MDITNLIVVDISQAKIDVENNKINKMSIMSNVAMDTNGEVFREFTDTAMNEAPGVFEGALARIDHDRSNTSTEESRGVRTGYGVYQNVRREGDMIFGDLYLWDCEQARKVLSIAQRTPHAVGNSIHTGGIVTEDKETGREIVQHLLPKTSYGFKPSVDLVEDPAATIGLFNSKKRKEKTMDYKDLTQASIVTNRPDLEEIFKAEGRKERDAEVKKLEQEKEELTKENDTLKVEKVKNELEILATKAVADSELPDYAKTDVFMKQLVQVKATKDITVEQGMKALIDDRILALGGEGGVKDNDEKGDVKQNKGKGTMDFADAFGTNKEGFQG